MVFPMVFPMVSYGLPPPFDPIFHGSMWLDTGSCQATYTFSGFRVGQPTMVSGPELLHGKQNPYPMTDPWQYAILMVCHLPSTYPSHVSIYIYIPYIRILWLCLPMKFIKNRGMKRKNRQRSCDQMHIRKAHPVMRSSDVME